MQIEVFTMTIADRLPLPPDLDSPFPTGLRMTEEEFVVWYVRTALAELAAK